MSFQFVCFVNDINDKEYTVLINTEDKLLIPQKDSDKITTRRIKANISLPTNELIYVTDADFNVENKEVIVKNYMKLVTPEIITPKEPSFTNELSELIKKMILDKTCYPIDMFK